VVFAGVDTHKDWHTAAVLDEHGHKLAVRSFPATGCSGANGIACRFATNSLGVSRRGSRHDAHQGAHRAYARLE
jgi:hypothetical protein